MKKTSPPKPTDSELAILRVLWRSGPATVRAVHDELNRTQETGYTTVLKLLQIMTEKGLVKRDESERSHVYKPAFSEERVQRQLVGHLLERAFGGSAQKLVLQALAAKKSSAADLAEIRKLLDEMEGDAK
jgi:BlaI family transcriptional regulator, penicillinase repressor